MILICTIAKPAKKAEIRAIKEAILKTEALGCRIIATPMNPMRMPIIAFLGVFAFVRANAMSGTNNGAVLLSNKASVNGINLRA